MDKKLFRMLACGERMRSRGDLRFVTLTFGEGNLGLRECRARWRDFVNGRWWRDISRNRDRVQVWEIHPGGHGWHLHMLVNFYIPFEELQFEAMRSGFGEIVHIEYCKTDGIVGYVCKYMLKSKRRAHLEGVGRCRLVNVSRGLVALSDINVSSPSIEYVRSRWRFISGNVSLRWRMLYLRWLQSFCSGEVFYDDI